MPSLSNYVCKLITVSGATCHLLFHVLQLDTCVSATLNATAGKVRSVQSPSLRQSRVHVVTHDTQLQS